MKFIKEDLELNTFEAIFDDIVSTAKWFIDNGYSIANSVNRAVDNAICHEDQKKIVFDHYGIENNSNLQTAYDTIYNDVCDEISNDEDYEDYFNGVYEDDDWDEDDEDDDWDNNEDDD